MMATAQTSPLDQTLRFTLTFDMDGLKDLFWQGALIYGIKMNSFRIGNGFDVHRLVEGRRCIVCGVDIPYEKGLLGHSDADVALHALSDALLGAAALGDIGLHFPDTDERWRGADSRMLLRRVVEIIADKGFVPGNVDITIIAQAPKMRPHIDAMRANVAADLGIDIDCVGIKATTTEHLGFTGRGEGIAAQAVAMITRIAD